MYRTVFRHISLPQCFDRCVSDPLWKLPAIYYNCEPRRNAWPSACLWEHHRNIHVPVHVGHIVVTTARALTLSVRNCLGRTFYTEKNIKWQIYVICFIYWLLVYVSTLLSYTVEYRIVVKQNACGRKQKRPSISKQEMWKTDTIRFAYRLFATRVSHLKIWYFWVINIERNVCRCTFNRYNVITQFVMLATGEQLCRRCTHRKYSTSKHLKSLLKNHTFRVVTLLLWRCCCDTVVMTLVVTQFLWRCFYDAVVLTRLLWRCCCDTVVMILVVTLLLWRCFCDALVVTLLLWRCFCDALVVTLLSQMSDIVFHTILRASWEKLEPEPGAFQ